MSTTAVEVDSRQEVAIKTERVKQEFLVVPLSSIYIANPRTDEDPGIEGLAGNIELRGLINPISVKPANSEGKHEIVTGRRRFTAVNLLSSRKRWVNSKGEVLDKIAVIIRHEPEISAKVAEISENLYRRGLDPFDEAESFKKFGELRGIRSAAAIARQLSDELGPERGDYNQKYVSRSLSIGSLPEWFKKDYFAFVAPIDREYRYNPIRKTQLEELSRIIADQEKFNALWATMKAAALKDVGKKFGKRTAGKADQTESQETPDDQVKTPTAAAKAVEKPVETAANTEKKPKAGEPAASALPANVPLAAGSGEPPAPAKALVSFWQDSPAPQPAPFPSPSPMTEGKEKAETIAKLQGEQRPASSTNAAVEKTVTKGNSAIERKTTTDAAIGIREQPATASVAMTSGEPENKADAGPKTDSQTRAGETVDLEASLIDVKEYFDYIYGVLCDFNPAAQEPKDRSKFLNDLGKLRMTNADINHAISMICLRMQEGRAEQEQEYKQLAMDVRKEDLEYIPEQDSAGEPVNLSCSTLKGFYMQKVQALKNAARSGDGQSAARLKQYEVEFLNTFEVALVLKKQEPDEYEQRFDTWLWQRLEREAREGARKTA